MAETLPPFPSDVPTADILNVDFRKLQLGAESEVHHIYDAAIGYGFFYLNNHDIDSSSMFQLAGQVFDLPLEEKMKYDMGNRDSYFGYKRTGVFIDDNGKPDHSQFYNISKNDMFDIEGHGSMEHPVLVNNSRESIRNFMEASHKVIDLVLRALGNRLGLNEDALPRMHQISRPSGCQTRLTHAPPLQSGVVSIPEHTDFGSITVLFNKLGGLQVLSPTMSKWLYVRTRPGSAIINLGDAVVKLAGGRCFSGLHRVVGPPGEQANYQRHSVVYFCRPNSDVKLRSLFPEDGEDEVSALLSDEWIKKRVISLASRSQQDPEVKKFRAGTAHNNREMVTKLAESAVAAN